MLNERCVPSQTLECWGLGATERADTILLYTGHLTTNCICQTWESVDLKRTGTAENRLYVTDLNLAIIQNIHT